ncbi:MAG: hypothetical protein BIFFINMI_00968 [Phycisphaerae bacterium]|nr:hypothetical protein [Phycisphaerae bacterium]
MVRASHVIFGTYGFWLPNDPRGSWSDFVGAWELARFGKATRVTTRASLAWRSHDMAARLAAKKVLKYPFVRLTGRQARAVGRGFGVAAEKGRIAILACSILPEHVHLVLARHRSKAEQVVNYLKGEATRQLLKEGIHPLADLAGSQEEPPQMWARGAWKVFLNSQRDIRRAIDYVRRNPIEEGMPHQRWGFVVEGNERVG